MTVPGRRRPGIRFEAKPPQLETILPRMDIAAFVGFAATGPLHLPVAIESAQEFEEIFGFDTPLAWDPRRGETVYGLLAPSVRAFFRTGGTRCWVTRVAARTAVNYFPIPGLVRLSAGHLTPAFARGRADGSWCDHLRVASAIAARPIDVDGATHADAHLVVEASLASPDDLASGDLLRLQLAPGLVAVFAVTHIVTVEGSAPSGRRRVRASGEPLWFRPTLPAPSSGSLATAVIHTAVREPASIDETFARAPVPIVNPRSAWDAFADGLFHLDLALEVEEAPEPGTLVSVSEGTEQLWLSVRNVGVIAEQAGGIDRVRVSGPGLWRTHAPPVGELHVTHCDRISLELWVRGDDVQMAGLRNLGLAPHHPRYWANLIHDDLRYRQPVGDASRLDGLAGERRFPLAGAGPADALYVPIDIALTPERFLGPARQPRSSLERDGLDSFSPALFLDSDLISPLSERLLSEAEHVRYTAESPRRLTGIHAGLEIDEATVVAVPDASHRGWKRATLEPPPEPQAAPPVVQPEWGAFLDCGRRVIETPQWASRFTSGSPLRFDAGIYTLEWQGREGDDFLVEEAQRPDWSDASILYSGADTRLNIYGHRPGTYYYRVRATADSLASDWSRAIAVVVAGVQQWLVADERSYSPETLLTVHRALLRMAAARGDLFALLTLPEHYRASEAAAHAQLLTSGNGPVIPVATDQTATVFSLPIDTPEARAFSFGALYHPWVLLREQQGAGALRRVPPDGCMAGCVARVALTRGAWIAPANEPLDGVVALSPAVGHFEHEALLDARVNPIVQEARGFLPLSAVTLSSDPNLELTNVRRLLGLLRRLALREGATYVFEPHSDAFGRVVHRGFEELLTHLFERGAFAGEVAASAFEVNTSTSLNPPRSVEHGRFVVELRVAPSLPMSFLTVRLVQSGDRTLVMEER
jgi:hypothetical protein